MTADLGESVCQKPHTGVIGLTGRPAEMLFKRKIILLKIFRIFQNFKITANNSEQFELWSRFSIHLFNYKPLLTTFSCKPFQNVKIPSKIVKLFYSLIVE